MEWGGDVHCPHGDEAQARETAALTEKCGLRTAAYGSYYRVGEPETSLTFRKVLDSAVALRAPVIRVWAGTKGSAETDPSHRAWIVRELRQIADSAAEQGVRIALEYHGGTLTDTCDAALALVEETGHANVRLLWQPAQGLAAEQAARDLRRVVPWLEHLHVFYWWPKAERHPLETGADRWRTYFSVLKDEKREIPVLLEFVQGDSEDQLRRDAETLQHLVREWSS
jgi:sugar phosphate isomerase/epimerase